jgi:hypothetical protein
MTTKVHIDPGICKLPTNVTAEAVDEDEVKLTVRSGCEPIRNMFKDLGDTFGTFEVCLRKPGDGPFFDYAREHFPGHVSCPAIAGIIKAMEVEGGLALPCDCAITFKEVDK